MNQRITKLTLVGVLVAGVLVMVWIPGASKPTGAPSTERAAEVETSVVAAEKNSEADLPVDVKALLDANAVRLEEAKLALREQNQILEELKETEEGFENGKLTGQEYLDRRSAIARRVLPQQP